MSDQVPKLWRWARQLFFMMFVVSFLEVSTIQANHALEVKGRTSPSPITPCTMLGAVSDFCNRMSI